MTPSPCTPVSSLSFFRFFANLQDPRRVCRTTYRFLDLVFIALAATIAGADDPHAMAVFARERRVWLQKYCQFPVDPETKEILTPSHDTFERLLQRLNPAAFARCFGRWTGALAEHLGLKQVAIDGKCLRGSGSVQDGLRALHLVQAWSIENHLCLGQVSVDQKSNEITAIPALLELLELKGALVSIDAIGCQKKIAGQIVEAGGDYLLPVKGNQENLLEDVQWTFELAAGLDFEGITHDFYETHERGHGRQERRAYIVMYNLGLIEDREKWAKLATLGLCIREREIDGKWTMEDHYFISSRKLSAKAFAEGARGHWGIENNLHWQLDVTFGEDDKQATDRNTVQNLAAIRRQALAMLKRHPAKLSIDNKRYKATLTESFLEEVLQIG
jgi:predicted transposase YbfD/YdcC